MQRLKVVAVVGARPNFMKIAPLLWAAAQRPDSFEFRLVHTGQHYDKNMNEVFFQELDIREPDIHLGVGSGSHAEQTARIMVALEKVLVEDPADLVLVVGDVNSTLAAALVAAKLHVPTAHVEAGLRSRDRRMPEEINRMVTDCLSEVLFTTSRLADRNLLAEGVPPERICLVGNIMIDTLIHFLGRAEGRDSPERLGLARGGYGLVTLHRPGNVDDAAKLTGIIDTLCRISRELPVVFPIHPRTRGTLAAFGLFERLEREPGVVLTEPQGYLDFLSLMRSSRLVISDSGGIQEETTYLKIPCLTLRENTERPETVEFGTNLLIGHDGERLYAQARRILDGDWKAGGELEFWDGRVAERILDELERRSDRLTAPPAERLVDSGARN